MNNVFKVTDVLDDCHWKYHGIELEQKIETFPRYWLELQSWLCDGI